jgi:hypothetical protein
VGAGRLVLAQGAVHAGEAVVGADLVGGLPKLGRQRQCPAMVGEGQVVVAGAIVEAT